MIDLKKQAVPGRSQDADHKWPENGFEERKPFGTSGGLIALAGVKAQRMEERERKPPKPTCKALLLCDDTILEAGTGKISLIGVFRRFLLHRIPGRTRPFHAFIQLTNAQGRYDVVVEVRDLQTDDMIAEASGIGIEIPDRLDVCNIVVPVPSLPIEHEGVYDFIVFANNEEIDRQQFRATTLPASDLEDGDVNSIR